MFVPLLLNLAVAFAVSLLVAAIVNTGSTNFINAGNAGNDATFDWATLSTSETALIAVFYLAVVAVEIVGYCWLFCMAREAMQEGGTFAGSSFRMMRKRLPAFVGTLGLIGVIAILLFLSAFLASNMLHLPAVSFIMFLTSWIVPVPFLMLAMPATVVGELGPFAAIADSIRKARANFGRLLAFIGLIVALFIAAGLIVMELGAVPFIGYVASMAWSIGFGILSVPAVVRLYGDIAGKENA